MKIISEIDVAITFDNWGLFLNENLIKKLHETHLCQRRNERKHHLN
jgi:hypothetical protein